MSLFVAPRLRADDDKPDLSRWTDDFSDVTTLVKHWSSYGFLAGGIDAKNPLGKPVGAQDGRLRCRFKIPGGGMTAIGIREPNPILEKS